MKSIFLTLLLTSLISASISAQDPVAYQQGRLTTSINYTEIEGTPYLFDFWLAGEATAIRNELFKPLQVKYNVIEDKLIFLSEDQKAMDFVKPLKAFVLYDASGNALRFKNGFPKYGNFDTNAFYQVLSEGKISLLKKWKKSIQETKEFNSPVVKKKFSNSEILLVVSGNQLVDVGKDKNAFFSIFTGQRTAVESYVNKEKINLKKEKDVSKVLDYYNSL